MTRSCEIMNGGLTFLMKVGEVLIFLSVCSMKGEELPYIYMGHRLVGLARDLVI